MSLRTLGGQILIGPSGPIDCDSPCCTGGSGPPGPCNYVVDCSDVNLDADGTILGPHVIPLNVEDACPWHVETQETSMITLNPPTSHLSAGLISFDVGENVVLAPRSGIIDLIKTSIGPGDPICSINVNQSAPNASCAGLLVPPTLSASGGPITVEASGLFVTPSIFGPWNGVLAKNSPYDTPCLWGEFNFASWLGYQLSPFELYGPGDLVVNAWGIRASATFGYVYYQKLTGISPVGVYKACVLSGAPAPLQVPQTLTIS